MSRLKPSLDDSALRSQLSDLKQSVDNSTKQLIDKILRLSPVKLLILSIVYCLDKATSKEIAEKIFFNRNTVGKYLGELAKEDNLLGFVEAINDNPSFPGLKTYFVLNESTKIILGFVAGAVKPIIDLSNHENNGTLPKGIVEYNFDNLDENLMDNKLITIEQIRQIYQNIPDLPPTSQKIYSLLDETPKTVKQFSERIGCDYTTASKHLKKYWDLGIAHRKIASSSGTGRGEFLYFLNPDVAKAQSRIKNQHPTPAPATQLELGDTSHADAENTTISTSNIKTCQSSEGVNMSTESSQQQSVGQPIDTNVAERFDDIDDLNEIVAHLEQIEKIEKRLRARSGSKVEKLIAIVKSKKS
ncbi:MAG: winged helix-turn-helix domain-containing protein [Nostoc sp. DedSLP03]|uniref:winged helix-turn-helix domain-containing protein n=1 Tax=Nostoc sp. DedSLP03 TaxID=3075400 RepID=UPI002AD36C18|nr:winged helix-turn-helix domain-containing protein [Nostoc sp. DedSLP03]MDZ7965545.1 winged helix-turn-helix domain-containing protein [Nostoc sp. DedSLP03]